MQITKKLVNKILKEIHTDMHVDKDVVENLQIIFEDYVNLNAPELLEKLPPELRESAREIFNECKRDETIIIYLLSQVLELSWYCAKDHKKVRITMYHVWFAILNDFNLKVLFKHPNLNLPIIPNITNKALEIHGTHTRALKNNITNKMRDIDHDVTSDVYSIIYNILNEASNNYLQAKDIISKIRSLGKKYNENGESPIRQLHNAILDVLVDKLKNKQSKITFTVLNDIVGTMKGELDYLFIKK